LTASSDVDAACAHDRSPRAAFTHRRPRALPAPTSNRSSAISAADCCPDRKDEPRRHGALGAVCQWIESVIDTLKGQRSLERHGARTMPGLMARIAARLLALAAALRHKQLAGSWDRSLIAYDH
jgi:hypothetical protein